MLLTFNKLKTLAKSKEVVAAAVRESNEKLPASDRLIDVSEDGSKVGCR